MLLRAQLARRLALDLAGAWTAAIATTVILLLYTWRSFHRPWPRALGATGETTTAML